MKFTGILQELLKSKTLKKIDPKTGLGIMPNRKRATPSTIDFSKADSVVIDGVDLSVVESGDGYKWNVIAFNKLQDSGFVDTPEEGWKAIAKWCDANDVKINKKIKDKL